MSTENQTYTMKLKLARKALQRYYEAKDVGLASQKQKNSCLQTLDGLDILKYFSEPEVVFDKFETATYKKRGIDTLYSKSAKENWGKTLSAIAQNLSKKEMVEVLDEHYDRKGDRNSQNKKKRLSDDQKKKAFEVNIIDEYKSYNGANRIRYREGNVTQMMNERQTRAYQPYDRLLNRLLKLATEFKQKGLNMAKDVYDYQFVVAGLIFLLAKRNRRLDIVNTMLSDSEEANVVLQHNGIFVKKLNKTKEKQVLLEFQDERLIDAVDTLVEIRRRNNKTCLFLKLNGDIPPTTRWLSPSKWFAESFTKVMDALGVGKKLTMQVFRIAYGIKLSQEHNGSLVSERHIEDAMGHSWAMHQSRYNLTALEELNNIEDGETE